MVRNIAQQLLFGLSCTNVFHRGSFGHGVPPQIAKSQYDVPLPTIDSLVPPHARSTERVRAARCHIALCRLTEILGELLPLVYGLQVKLARESSKKLRQIRTDLDLWEDSLPDWLRSPTQNRGDQLHASSSLQLAFLAVKMLISRVELNVSTPTIFLIVVRLTIFYRRSTMRKQKTPKLVGISRQNVANQRRISCGLFHLCARNTSRSSGSLVRHPYLPNELQFSNSRS